MKRALIAAVLSFAIASTPLLAWENRESAGGCGLEHTFTSGGTTISVFQSEQMFKDDTLSLRLANERWPIGGDGIDGEMTLSSSLLQLTGHPFSIGGDEPYLLFFLPASGVAAFFNEQPPSVVVRNGTDILDTVNFEGSSDAWLKFNSCVTRKFSKAQ